MVNVPYKSDKVCVCMFLSALVVNLQSFMHLAHKAASKSTNQTKKEEISTKVAVLMMKFYQHGDVLILQAT